MLNNTYVIDKKLENESYDVKFKAKNVNDEVADSKKIEKKLLELRRFRHLLDIVNDAILVTELSSGMISDVNQSACKMLGYSRSELLECKIVDFLSEKNIKLALEKLQTYNKVKKINYRISTKLITKFDDEIPVEVSIRTAAFDKKLYAIFIARDVSQRISAEKELIKAKEIAERSDRLKTEFLAQISHEIRTPLNSILSLISLLKDELKDKLPEDLNSSIRIIDDGSKRLIRTIEQILNMSQVQTGNIELEKRRINLSEEILEYLALDFYSVCKKKGIALEFYNFCQSPVVHADFDTVNQIFTNLIDNAVKYTHYGHVEIKIYNNNSGEVCVDVKDTGIGISEFYLPLIFQPFSQEENLKLKTNEGTGLGLAIVKKFAELNNAEITVRSVKGKGSIFTVVFKNKL